MRFKLRQFLENDGYSVIEAEDGSQVQSLYERLQPDLILMDCIMPVMDGCDACARLQELPGGERTPIIMITSLNDDKAVDRAFEAGATDYITKPIHWAVLRQRVRRMLRARHTEVSLDQTEAFAQSIINHALDGIITIDMRGKIQSFNPASERIFGYPFSKAIGQPINMLIPKFYPSDNYLEIEELNGEDEFIGKSREVMGRRKDGSTFPIELTVSDFYVGEQRFFTVIIRHQVFHDSLTGLPNRMLFRDRLALAMAHAKRNKLILAVLFLDLDRFKLINDSLGYPVGNQLLKIVAGRLTKCVREEDTVARNNSGGKRSQSCP